MSYVVCRWTLDEEEKFRILPFSTFVRSRNQLRNNIEKENENEKKSRIDVVIKSTFSITKST